MVLILPGKHLFQSSFLTCNFIKWETLAQGFFYEFCNIFKNNLFTKHMWMTAFILPQLLPLHFAIIYSLQLSSSERSSMYLKEFKNLDFFFFSFFLIFHLFCYFLWQMPIYLGSYAKSILYSEPPTVSLAQRHLSTMILNNFENLNFISNIFQETPVFLLWRTQ